KAGKADFTLTAEQFHKEASDKQQQDKYKGKTVELTGTVKGAGKNISGTVYLSLQVGSDLVGVQCYTTDQKPWEKATPGQKVRIRGQFPEIVVFPALVGCTIVEVSGPKAPPVQAADLAKEYAADREAAVKKYNGKWLILSGEVEEKKTNDVGAVGVYLRTGQKVKVACNFTA